MGLTWFPLHSIITHMDTEILLQFERETRHVIRTGSLLAVCLIGLASSICGCGASPVPLAVASPSISSSAKLTTTSNVPPHRPNDAVVVDSSEIKPAAEPLRREAVRLPETPATARLSPASPFESSGLVGHWSDTFFGHRTLILNADGTALMRLKLDFAGRLLYGKQIEFDMRWSLDDCLLKFEITGGRPDASAASAMKVWGESFEYTLEELTDESLQVRGSDGTTVYKLVRMSTAE